MSLPLPFDTKERTGWWANPEPFIVLPFIVASDCGHYIHGGTIPTGADSIPATAVTHCSDCTTVDMTWSSQSPITGIPTVVGSVCRHALSGIYTPIGPNTIPAALTPLCQTCNSYSMIATETSRRHKEWQDYVEAAHDSFKNPQEDGANNPIIKEYLSQGKRLARRYERLLVMQENTALDLLEAVDPALPVVDLDGVVLLTLPVPESPQARQRTPRRVTFDEDQHHPSRETARKYWQFKRSQRPRSRRANAYEPGRYAAPTGKEWENTSSPELEESGDGSSEGDMLTRGPGAGLGGNPFLSSEPMVVYTPSSLPAQPQGTKQDPEEASSVSEK